MKNVIKFGFISGIAGLSLTIGQTAQATTISFDSPPFGNLNTDTLAFPEATFVSTDGLLTTNQGLCAYNTSDLNCQADLAVNFTNTVNNLSFTANGFNTGDEITVDAFGISGFLGNIVFASNGLVDLSAFSNVSAINIQFTGTEGAGFLYNDFIFDEASTIPTPALLPGLIGMGVAALRKRKQED